VSGSSRRIGVFGGAFDPPHAAHHALAQAALQQLALDALHIVPTGQAWHKARTLSAAEHRLAMARLAFADLPGTVVDLRETQRSGPSYTVDTLEALASENPGAALFLLVGEDQASALHTWHRWPDILRLATICVAARAHTTRASAPNDAKPLDRTGWHTLHMPHLAVSATEIRQRLAQGQPVDTLVTEPVARYIAHHHLYQTA
jgi:nicotinate-nucleotide adenylyltransferase